MGLKGCLQQTHVEKKEPEVEEVQITCLGRPTWEDEEEEIGFDPSQPYLEKGEVSLTFKGPHAECSSAEPTHVYSRTFGVGTEFTRLTGAEPGYICSLVPGSKPKLDVSKRDPEAHRKGQTPTLTRGKGVGHCGEDVKHARLGKSTGSTACGLR